MFGFSNFSEQPEPGDRSPEKTRMISRLRRLFSHGGPAARVMNRAQNKNKMCVIKIQIRSRGTPVELAVFGGDTIAQIKTKVFEQEGITLTALYYSGEQLQNHRTLDFHNIPKNALLYEAPE